jgi:hypothetical protein
MASTCSCVDLLGNRYEYTLLPFEADWNEVSGVHIFVRWDPGSGWQPLYIGGSRPPSGGAFDLLTP